MKNKYLKFALIALAAIMLISLLFNIDDFIRGFIDGFKDGVDGK
ncbi:hypothetical protein [Pedobacter sp.]